jgi:hypothetical protein
VDESVSPRRGVNQWLADWRNEQGDVVSYGLSYTAIYEGHGKPGPPENQDLHVTAFLIPAQQASAMAKQAAARGAK